MLRRIARPLLAIASIANGVETLINPKPKVETATPLLAKGQQMVPAAQGVNPALIVQAGAVVKIAAGTMMAVGWVPRLAATVLAADLIPSTVAEHPFWSSGYPDDRKAHTQNFIKNAGLLGGLLFAITSPAGNKNKKKRKKKRG